MNYIKWFDNRIDKLERRTGYLARVIAEGGGSGGGAVTSVAGKTGIVTLVPGDVGLGNVNNVSDADKPVSTAVQTALNGKQNQLNGTGFVKANGTSVTYDNNSYALASHTHTASQITDFISNARSAISLTTTGSGAATYNISTGALNIPTPSGAGTPGGSDTQIQYNNAGAFGGSGNLVFTGQQAAITTSTNTTYGTKGLRLNDTFNGGSVVLQPLAGQNAMYVTTTAGAAAYVSAAGFNNPNDGNQFMFNSGEWAFSGGNVKVVSLAGAGIRLVTSATDGTLGVAAATAASLLMTGYVSGAGTVSATDTILQAINKLNGNDSLKAPLASPTFTGNVVAPALYGQTASAGFINIQGTTNATKGKVWLNSAIQTQLTTLTATTTVTFSHTIVWCDATSGAITMNLPTASTSTGVIYMFKKIDTSANAVTIDPNGAETIDGAATYVLREQDDSVLIQSNGTVWRILMKSTRNPQAISPNGTVYRINVSDAGVVSTTAI